MSELRRPTFDEVLASARSGSPWALGWLYRRFQPALHRTLAVIAPHRAEDVASDVWLDVAGALPRFSGDEQAFRSWLAATARRRVIEAARPPTRRHLRALPGEGAGRIAGAAFAAGVAEVLSPDQAEVVVMRVVDGLEVDEVARALGKTSEAVRGLQHRALRRMARQLDPDALPA